MATMIEMLVPQVQSLADHLQSVEEIDAAIIQLNAPLRTKRSALRKADMEAKRKVREEAAENLCRALKPGEKVKMCEHGYLDIFNPGSGDVFFDADATVHMYQPRKQILWLNVTGSRSGRGKKDRFEQCRPFRLHEVASYNVRRATP